MTSLVMGCISTVSFSFLVNEVSYGKLISQRVLRQGCPLSPYLFLLCAQGLSALFYSAERDEIMQGFSSSRAGPWVLHLCFVDDSLVFWKAKLIRTNIRW